MTEREPVNRDRVQVDVGVAPIDCFIDGRLQRRINGVGVRVKVDDETIWEKREYPNFLEGINFNYPPKPFFEARVKRAKSKANRLANSLRETLSS